MIFLNVSLLVRTLLSDVMLCHRLSWCSWYQALVSRLTVTDGCSTCEENCVKEEDMYSKIPLWFNVMIQLIQDNSASASVSLALLQLSFLEICCHFKMQSLSVCIGGILFKLSMSFYTAGVSMRWERLVGKQLQFNSLNLLEGKRLT